MLTDREEQEIRSELEHYPRPRAACVEVLKILQRSRGWVSDDSLRDAAEWLGMDVAEVESVATFFNLIFRRPVGKHVILVCDSVSCWIVGRDRILDLLRERLGIEPGETTPDGRITLLPVACLGACDRAPVLMVDDRLHTGVDEQALDEILQQCQADEG